MRENCTYGSEGGAGRSAHRHAPTPIRRDGALDKLRAKRGGATAHDRGARLSASTIAAYRVPTARMATTTTSATTCAAQGASIPRARTRSAPIMSP